MSLCSLTLPVKLSAGSLALGVSLLGALLGAAPARAHRHDFPSTYDWKQPSFGEKEIEAHTTYLKSDTSLEEEVEFEEGVTSRFSIAPYVVFGRGSDESLHYTGFQVEARYQLMPYQTNKVLSGLYEEFIQPKDERSGLESRIVLSRYDQQGGDISFNYVLTNSFASDPNYRHTYSVGYVRPFGHTRYDFRGGVEWIHDLSKKRINLGPVLGLMTSDNTSLVVGYAFALNRRDSNDEFRLIAEYEF